MAFTNARLAAKECNPVEYHRQKVERGDPNFSMSPSSLKEFIRCPSRWIAGYESPESKAQRYGSLFDCQLLTPGQFDLRYAVQPEKYVTTDRKPVTKPWSNNATVCKDWNAEQEKAGKSISTVKQLSECKQAILRLFQDPIISAWHEACEMQIWVEGNWQDEATGLFVPVRCLIDYVPRVDSEFARCLGDLKSSTSGALRPFQRQVYSYGYHIQAAFDLALYNEATGDDRNSWCFIGQENYPPFEPFKRILDPAFLTIGKQDFETGLRYYCQCLKKREWPGYDDDENAVQGWSICAPEPWMEYESLSSSLTATVEGELSQEQKIEMAGL